MKIKQINLEYFNKFLDSNKINAIFDSDSNEKITIYNNYGSYLLLILCEQFKKKKFSILYICLSKEEALSILNEVEQILGKEFVLFFPNFERVDYTKDSLSNKDNYVNSIFYFQVLNKLYKDCKQYFIISYLFVLSYKVFSFDLCIKKIDQCFVDQIMNLDDLSQILFSLKFNRVDFISHPGEFSIRGDILDVFSFSDINPFRILFSKNKIQEIKKFNIKNQRSLEVVKSCIIINNFQIHEFLLKKKNHFLVI